MCDVTISVIPSLPSKRDIIYGRSFRDQYDMFHYSCVSVACLEDIVTVHDFKTTWPTTLIGHITPSEELCVGDKGELIKRKCLGDSDTGAIWGPMWGECTEVSSILTLNLYQLAKVNITTRNILASSWKVNKWITYSDNNNMSFADVQLVSQILRNMAALPDIQPEVFRSILSIVDRVIGEEHSKLGERNSMSNVTNRISFAVESMLRNLNFNGKVFKASGSNIAVSVFPFGGATSATLIPTGGILGRWNSNLTTVFNGTSPEDLYSAFAELEAGILLPESLVSDRLAVVIHRNIHHVEDTQVVSPVIGVSVGNSSGYDVETPIEMIFNVPQLEKSTSLECVFWDSNLNDNNGGWSKKGCISHSVHPTHMRCSCDHLTRFAVISELRTPTNRVVIPNVSSLIYIGCIFSMIGLLTIIMTFILFKEYRTKPKHKVLFNLSLSLFVYMFIISVGLKQRENDVIGCYVVSLILHYCMLSSYSWMLIVSFIKYHLLVKVLGTYIPRFMQKACLFGWGFPVLFVVIVLSVDYDAYVSKNTYCWLARTNKVYYYAVTGPVVILLILTFVTFVLILRAHFCRIEKNLRTNQTKWKTKMIRFRRLLHVTSLLVLSWVHGVINVFGEQLVFQYLFAIILTLQGIFIVVFFIFVSDKTHKLWFGLFTNTPITPKINYIDVEAPSRRPSNQPCNNSQMLLTQLSTHSPKTSTIHTPLSSV